MVKFTIFIFVASMFIAIIAMVYSCTNKKKEYTDMQMYQMLSQCMFAQLESDGCSLDFKATEEGSILFSKEIETLPKFIFFHSELNCNSCVEENIPFINNFCNEIGMKNVIYLASYKNERDLHLFKRINKIPSQIYNMESIGLKIEKFNTPFCFVLNKNFKAECVFIPLKEDSSNFNHYLKIIKEKYFN